MTPLRAPRGAGGLLATLGIATTAIIALTLALRGPLPGTSLLTGPLGDSLGDPLGPLANLAGTVAHADGSPAAGVVVDLYRSLPNGARAHYLATTTSAPDGSYWFQAEPGCYRLVFTDPSQQPPVAVARTTGCDDDGASRRLDAVLPAGPEPADVLTSRFGASATETWDAGDSARPGAGREPAPPKADEEPTGLPPAGPPGDSSELGSRPDGLSDIEWELYLLTNELRSEPAGRLRRQGERPDCLDDPYYVLEVDTRTGHPEPAPPLALDPVVSVEMARAWAAQMEGSGTFAHRPSTAQQQLYHQLGISALAWGENIAWSGGHTIPSVAMVHFEGWRESNSGHYCTLVSPRFSRIGIGEVHQNDESWAVQNFYHPATLPLPPQPATTPDQ